MFEKKQPGKKIKEVLSQLGDKYSIQTIDFENCIYLNLGNGYDIEVSGLDNAKKVFHAKIYVWDARKGDGPIEQIPNITSFDMLKDCLIKVEEKYLQRHS